MLGWGHEHPAGDMSTPYATRAFPSGFLWGTATASYQIEGAVSEDGRTPSIWDTFSHTPGTIVDGTTGDVATDHYHRWREDVEIMAALGLGAYRFSLSWSRILPAPGGAVNQAGLDFYSRLVDALLDHGIRPFATLYHWDLPQYLQDAGGWLDRDTTSRFAEYAGVVAEALGDRVATFTTFNEPWCSAFLGHASGVHAPGHRNPAEAYAVAHHLLLAHGLAVPVLRAAAPGAAVSITINPANVRAASDSDADRDAARHVDGIANRIFLDPLLRGSYPADVQQDLRHVTDFAFLRDGDLATIAAPIDILGVNYYSPALVAAATPELVAAVPDGFVNDPQSAGSPSPWPGTDLAFAMPQEGPYTAMGWRIEPGSFTELLLRLHRDYPGTPMMITENGAAFDEPDEGGTEIDDADRIAYLTGHIGAVHEAITAGVDLRGYFAWSLVDNFEWALGNSKRFGIVHVDYATQERTPKRSAAFYRDVAAANALS